MKTKRIKYTIYNSRNTLKRYVDLLLIGDEDMKTIMFLSIP